jgi:N-hydroxyarylamine O-acetyltransferase
MRIPNLVEPILEKLGLAQRPSVDLAGLSLLYANWCRKVPFDNLRKRLLYSGDSEGPVPGHNSQDFYENWLAHGTGGTCWATTHALHDLLSELGFPVTRGAGTMLAAPGVVGPTHGTAVVTLEDRQYIVDGSMQTEQPLLIQEGGSPGTGHPASRTRFENKEGLWHLLWHPPHRIEGLWCRIEQLDVPVAEFDVYHERTRTSSLFNAALYIRLNQSELVNTIAFGERVIVGDDGEARKSPLPVADRARVMIEEFGISEEMAAKIPADEPSSR